MPHTACLIFFLQMFYIFFWVGEKKSHETFSPHLIKWLSIRKRISGRDDGKNEMNKKKSQWEEITTKSEWYEMDLTALTRLWNEMKYKNVWEREWHGNKKNMCVCIMFYALFGFWQNRKKNSFRFVDNQRNQFTTYQLHTKESEIVERN